MNEKKVTPLRDHEKSMSFDPLHLLSGLPHVIDVIFGRMLDDDDLSNAKGVSNKWKQLCEQYLGDEKRRVGFMCSFRCGDNDIFFPFCRNG